MAKPIKETPILVEEDATRFEQVAHAVVPASKEEKDSAQKAFNFFASIAIFSM